MPKYVVESFLDNLVDCQLDLIYEQGVSAVLPHDKTDNIPSCGLVVHQIDVSALLQFFLLNQTVLEDLSNGTFCTSAGTHRTCPPAVDSALVAISHA